MDVVEDVYTLYTQAFDVTTLEEGEEINLSFWKSTGSERETENDLMHIANPDARILLPRDVMPDVIEELKFPEESTVEWIGSWSLAGNTLEFEVEFGSEPTPEYPIHVEMNWEKTDNDIHEFGKGQFNFSVNTDDLSVKQYFELLDIQDKDDIQEIEFCFQNSDKTHQQRFEESFEGLDLPEPEDRSFLEFVERISLATDIRISLPDYISEKHLQVYSRYAGCDLDSDTADEILSELQECGEVIMRSYVGAAVWGDEPSSVDVEKDEPVYFEELGMIPGIFNVREDQDSEESERYPGDEYHTYPADSKYSYEELLDKLREDYGGTFSDLQQSEVDSEEVESEFSHRIYFGEETLWGTIDQHIIDIFPVSEDSSDERDSLVTDLRFGAEKDCGGVRRVF